MTISDQLTAINEAITAIESGAQEYQIKDRRVRRPDLVVLYKERQNLQQQLTESNYGGPFGVSTLARFTGR